MKPGDAAEPGPKTKGKKQAGDQTAERGPGEKDMLWREASYTDATQAFIFRPVPIKEVFPSCDVVLDANVLINLYRMGSKQVEAVERAFRKLREEKRIFLPAQAVREYLCNRPQKLGDAFRHANDVISKVVSCPRLPTEALFTGCDAWKQGQGVRSEVQDAWNKVQEVAKEFEDTAKKYKTSLLSLRDAVQTTSTNNDPFWDMYRSIFGPESIIDRDPGTSVESIRDSLARNIKHKTPPGYKDAGKDDGGPGDLLVWLSILELGKKRSQHVIFVSGDQKADWQHSSGGRPFMPRIELIEEYRLASRGKTFHLAALSQLLELMETVADVVAAVKEEEAHEAAEALEAAHVLDAAGFARSAGVEFTECPHCHAAARVLGDQIEGAVAKVACDNCGSTSLVERCSEGAVSPRIMPSHWRSTPTALVQVQCPFCARGVSILIGRGRGSSVQVICTGCLGRTVYVRSDDGQIAPMKVGYPTQAGTPAYEEPWPSRYTKR